MAATGPDETALERDSERQYFCQDLIQTLTIALLCVGWFWGVLLIAAGISFFDSAYWLSPASLMLAGALSYSWRERNLRLAALLLLAALWLAPTAAAYAVGNPLYLLGLSFGIVVAGVLARPPAVALTAGLSLGSVLWLVAGPVPARGTLSVYLLALAGSLGLSWLLCYQLGVALESSQANRRRATRQMLEARQRRADLRRALKSLDEEYERLAHLNRELQATRREAEEARRHKAEFAANVSHELRTPLNLIVGFSEMMYTAPESYGGRPLPPEYLADVHAIYRSAKHLQGLIDDVLDLARIDARRMALTREVADLGSVVSEAAGAIRELVERKGLELRVEVEPDLPAIRMDRTRIRQVLLNLVSNAARFTEAGYIRVSCGRYGDVAPAEGGGVYLPKASYVYACVSDSGVGIRPQDMETIFEEFRQADGSARRKHGGTGLGLAISKRFVELHGGWLWAESEVGKGSTFRFVLPMEEAELRPQAPQVRAGPAGRTEGKTVVFVDDDASVIHLLRRYLRGYRVEGAASAELAMPLIARLSPDLVALGDGTEAAEILARQAAYPELAHVRLTVLSCPVRSDHRRALDQGMTDYLAKPVARDQLWAALARLGTPVRSVLAVEDDPNMQRLLGRILSAGEPPMQLVKAYSGEEAQARLRDEVPDVVLLDLALPGMSGQELLRWMRADERLRGLPVIGITAQTHLEEVAPADLAALSLTRCEGFSLAELLGFIEAAADRFPSHYAGNE